MNASLRSFVRPPSFSQVVLFFALASLLSVAVTAALYRWADWPGDLLWMTGGIIFAGTLVGAAAAAGHPVSGAFLLRRPPRLRVARLLLFTVAAALPGMGGSLLWKGLTGAQPLPHIAPGDLTSTASFLAIYAEAVLVFPVVEELAFRGLLQGTLVPRLGARPAIVAAAAVFAAWHGLPGSILGAFLWALPVGWLAWRAGTILPGLLVHMLNNAIAVVLAATGAAGAAARGGAPVDEAVAGLPIGLGLLLIGIGGVALLRTCLRIDSALPPRPLEAPAAERPRWGAARRTGFAGVVAAFVLAVGGLGFVVERLPFGADGEPYYVGGDGMAPTLFSGDYLIVRPLGRPPFRGEVVLVHPFGAPEDTYVQRVVAVAGDTVAMVGGRLRVNGRDLEEPYVGAPPVEEVEPHRLEWMSAHAVVASADRPTPANWGPLIVPAGQLFLLGDNRANAYDGLFAGFVRCEWVVGAPIHIYFSFGAGRMRWDRVGPFDPTAGRDPWGDLWEPAPCPV